MIYNQTNSDFWRERKYHIKWNFMFLKVWQNTITRRGQNKMKIKSERKKERKRQQDPIIDCEVKQVCWARLGQTLGCGCYSNCRTLQRTRQLETVKMLLSATAGTASNTHCGWLRPVALLWNQPLKIRGPTKTTCNHGNRVCAQNKERTWCLRCMMHVQWADMRQLDMKQKSKQK